MEQMEQMFEQMTDESVVRPKRSDEEIEADVEYFINHPLNAKELTPEMLDRPEFKTL
jgi:hypothetical protein